MKLANKVALITGAGSGMGKSAALLFASEGAKVAAVDINEAQVRETVAAIKTQGGQALALRADVSKSGDVQRMVEETIAHLGTPTILYNNAGIEGESHYFANLPEEEFRCKFYRSIGGRRTFLTPRANPSGGRHPRRSHRAVDHRLG